MLENASQHIACDFDVSQALWNVPSQVYSIATCDWALLLVAWWEESISSIKVMTNQPTQLLGRVGSGPVGVCVTGLQSIFSFISV